MKEITFKDVGPLLNPNSIAIIGATPDMSWHSGRFQHNLMKYGYEGGIFPVNPKYEEVQGLKCYHSILDIPREHEVDLAIILVQARLVRDILQQCVDRGVKGALIFSAGFAELNEEGKQRQEGIKELAEKTGLRICGPNCMGMVNRYRGIPTYGSFAIPDRPEELKKGHVAVVAQSAGIGSFIFNRADPIGFSYVICSGNEVDAEAADFMKFMLDDPNTKVVAGHIEGFRNGRKFMAAADVAIQKRKPIVVYKVGRTEKGKKAAAAHTGALAGSDLVCDAVFKQKGITRAQSADDVLEFASFFARSPLPKGDGVGIVSGSGGVNTIVTDMCELLGLYVPEPSPRTKEEVGKMLTITNLGNPCDVVELQATPDRYRQFLDIFLHDENFQSLVIVLTPATRAPGKRLAEVVVDAVRGIDKPVVVLWGAGKLAEEGFAVLEDNNIPMFKSHEKGIEALAALIRYKQFVERHEQDKASSASIVGNVREARKILTSRNGALTEYESKKLLACYGIPIARESLAASPQEAVALAREIGYPVALKVVSAQITHKTEANVVKLNVGSEAELRESYAEILANARRYSPEARIDGVLVQKMVGGGTEVIVGISHDAQFGPTVMFGLGGIFVEVLKDVSLRVAPLTRRDAEEMIRETKGFKVLQGVRGRPKADIDAIIDVLLRVSQLAMDLEDSISELDINPLIIFEEGKGAKAVDALVIPRR